MIKFEDTRSRVHFSEKANRLLDEIVNCPQMDLCRRGEATSCSEIVSTQRSGTKHQPPEPWSGLIESAAILFLSSNPSIDDKGITEVYPADDWTPEMVRDSFSFRFGGGSGGFRPIQDGVRPPLKGGGYGRPVAFWRAVKKHADDILGYKSVPGVDYALSEVVHCKSRHEVGVAAAMADCTNRYLDRLLEVAAAPTIVVLGSSARTAVIKHYPTLFSELPPFGSVTKLNLASKSRLVAFMPHPNAHMKRSFADRMPESRFMSLRNSATAHPVRTDSPALRRLRLLSHQGNETIGHFTLHTDGAVTCDSPANVDILRSLRSQSHAEDGESLFTWADGWSNGYTTTVEISISDAEVN